MKTRKISQSRRETPWDNLSEGETTPLQGYLRDLYHERYKYHHQSLNDMNDNSVFDKYHPEKCPYCNSVGFVRNGRYKSTGLQRYLCYDCGQSFCITTGTIFEDHKISIGEWMQYLLNLFEYVSLASGSRNNKNSFTTSRYWLEKVFLVLKHYQDSIVLSGTVYLDETFYTVRKSDIVRKDGKQLRGISKNQLCIGCAADKKNVYCRFEGIAKPSSEDTLIAFRSHIKKRAKLIHDGDNSHHDLVEALQLNETVYYSEALKGLEDEDNPMDRINDVHSLLKAFLDSHSGFLRHHLDDYLNLFAFIMNPPKNKLKKVEIFLEMAIKTKATLRYRKFYKSVDDKEDFWDPEELWRGL
jgi:transposase-like protein